MAKYVVYKKHAFVPENEVFFHCNLHDAVVFRDDKQLETNEEWEVAESLPLEGRWGRFLTWLARKTDQC